MIRVLPSNQIKIICSIFAFMFIFCLLDSKKIFAQSSEHKQANLNVVEKKREKGKKRRAGDDGKPRLSKSEIFVISAQKQLIKGIDKVLGSLKSTLKRLPPKSPQRLQILERIHNLHLEQASYITNEEYRIYDTRWEKWDRLGRKGIEPKINDKRSKKHWSLVARSGSNLLKEFPKSKIADIVNLNQALALLFLGKEKQAARAFTALIKKYPNSSVAGDAYYALGDYYFDQGNFGSALTNYKSALRYPRSKRYGWALFKTGWAFYNLGKYRQSLNYWKKTVSYSRSASSPNIGKLKDEALRDMVYAFAELKQVEPAVAYFQVNGGQKYIGQFLTLLAQTLADQGLFQKSIKVWKRLQRVAPRAEEAYTAQSEIVNLAYELGGYKTLWRELKNFPKRYGRGSPWAAAQDKKFALEKHFEIRDQSLYYAKVIHQKAQKQKRGLYNQAKVGYKLFLENFPRSKQVVEAKYNLADIEYMQKNYRQAGNLYREIAMLKPNQAVIYDGKTRKPVENIHKTSARYMLDSYHRDFEPQLKKLAKFKPDPKKPPRPLSAQARNLIKACGNYVKWYPKEVKLVRSCDVTVADTYYKFNHIPKAIDSLWHVAKKYSRGKIGVEAVESLVPLLKTDKKRMVDVVTRLLQIPAYQKGALGAKLKGVLQGSEAEAIVADKNAKTRAIAWAKHAKKYPNAPDADKAWYNSAVDFLKAGMAVQAMNSYLTIVNKYRKSSLVKESVLQLAKISDKRYQLSSAAKYYLRFAAQFPNAKESPAATLRACHLTIAVSPEQAISPCSKLAVMDPKLGSEAYQRLYESFYLSGNLGSMASIITNRLVGKLPLDPNESIVALYRLYIAKGKSNDVGRKILGLFSQNQGKIEGEALRYVGEILFNRSRGVLPKVLGISILGGTVEKMNASIQKKSQAISQLESSMQQVLSSQDPHWGVAALYSIGKAYADLGKRLSNPPGINGAKPEEVKTQLAPLAKDAMNKAKGFLDKATNVAKKFDVMNEFSVLLANTIIELKDEKKGFVEILITPDFLGSEVPAAVARKL